MAMTDNYKRAFELMEKIGIIALIHEKRDGAKSQVSGFMDLNFDLLEVRGTFARIALSHNYVQNGDLMADPDMELRVHFYDDGTGAVEAIHFQQDSLGVFQRVYQYNENGVAISVDLKLKKDLIKFLVTWLRNATAQGHTFVGA